MESDTVCLSSKVRVPAHVAFNDLDGEAILLNLDTGKYYGLDEVGARIWNLIHEQHALQAVFKALSSEYEVDEAQLQEDLLKLVNDLASHGLVVVNDDADAAQPAK